MDPLNLIHHDGVTVPMLLNVTGRPNVTRSSSARMAERKAWAQISRPAISAVTLIAERGLR